MDESIIYLNIVDYHKNRQNSLEGIILTHSFSCHEYFKKNNAKEKIMMSKRMITFMMKMLLLKAILSNLRITWELRKIGGRQ